MAELTPVGQTETKLPENLVSVVNAFIDASYPRLYLSERAIDRLHGADVSAGVFMGGLAAVDIIFTALGNHKYSADELRDEAQARMEPAVAKIGAELSHNPDQVTVCRDEVSYPSCMRAETYNVRSQEGTVRFVTDELHSSELPKTEAAALVGALPEATGDRSQAFDTKLISGLEQGTKAFVATVEDQKHPTTNAYTGELVTIGLPLVLVAIGLTKALKVRLNRQERNLGSAFDALKNYRTSNHIEPSDDPAVSPDMLRAIKLSSGWEHVHVAHQIYKDKSSLGYGGQKARRKQRAEVQKAVVRYLPQLEAASKSS